MYFSVVTVSLHDGFHTMGQKNYFCELWNCFPYLRCHVSLHDLSPACSRGRMQPSFHVKSVLKVLPININSQKSVWLKIWKAARNNNKIDVKLKIIWFRRYCPSICQDVRRNALSIVVWIVDTKMKNKKKHYLLTFMSVIRLLYDVLPFLELAAFVHSLSSYGPENFGVTWGWLNDNVLIFKMSCLWLAPIMAR